jgi:hypothetical protein
MARASKLKMTVDEALAFADEWSRGMTIHAGSQGWRLVCMLLAEEVRMRRKGESICIKCGLRQDGDHPGGPEF